MKHVFPKDARVLAVDPYYQGFSFAVLEGASSLIAWGMRKATEDKNARCLREIDKLMARYRPEVVALEDYASRRSHRSERVEELIAGIKALAAENGVPTRHFSRAEVREAFAPLGARTKDQIAAATAGRFPELALRLPPPRKFWKPEHYAMSLFDAMAWAWAFFHFQNPVSKVTLRGHHSGFRGA